MTEAAITTVAELEGVIGKTPPPMHLKVIDHLDPGALHWISESLLIFAGFGATQARTILSVPGVTGLPKKGLDKDCRDYLC